MRDLGHSQGRDLQPKVGQRLARRAVAPGTKTPVPGPLADAAEERQLDASLVTRAQSGDMDAFAELLDRHQGKVYRMITRMLTRHRETAEDLTQEVFMRAFRGLPSFAGSSSFSTWIHRITTNVCISEIRARRSQKRDRVTVSLETRLDGRSDDDGVRIDPPTELPNPATAAERTELYEACRHAIARLPSLWKVILTLRDLEGKSYEEICEILSLPIGTVRSRLHRARAKVRTLMEGGAP